MEETKSKIVQVRIEPSTYAQIVQLAKRHRKKPSTMLRDLALDRLWELNSRADFSDAKANQVQHD